MMNSDIKLLDCTLRDGGLTNSFRFPLKTVRAVFKAVCEAGIDFIELGYRNSKKFVSPQEFGPFMFCEEEDLRSAVEGVEKHRTKIAIMQDAHKAVPDDLLPAKESVVDMIRIATYVKDIDRAIQLVNNATTLGYDCSLNIMAVSKVHLDDLLPTLQRVRQDTDVKIVYLVDSYGALLSDDIVNLLQLYRENLPGISIGVHFHNNLQMAFANSILGIKSGAAIADGTLMGLGRGAGNCPLESIVQYLSCSRYDIRPLIDAIQQHILPLQEKLKWGYQIPYMLTGALNKHPNEAIEWMKSSSRDKLTLFYEKITNS